MSDRDLLEAAARAAGYKNVAIWGESSPFARVNFDEDGRGSGTRFNPFNDDGDEARLEAALGLNVVWLKDRVILYRLAPGRDTQELFSDHGGDKQAARRRAGVRAAAALTQTEGGA